MVVFNKKGEVLAGERAGIPGALQFPQGGLDFRETPLEAARRELWEETGLHIECAPVHEIDEWLAYDFPPTIDNPRLAAFCGQSQKWFFFRWDGDPELLDLDAHHREFDRLLWTDIATVTQSIRQFAPFKAPVYERVADELRYALREVLGSAPA